MIDKDQKGYITKEDLLRVLETTDDDDLTEAANIDIDTFEQQGEAVVLCCVMFLYVCWFFSL